MNVGRLLDQLCIELGFCLHDDSRRVLLQDPPGDIDEFTDAVIRAEGLDPLITQPSIRSQIRERVERAWRT